MSLTWTEAVFKFCWELGPNVVKLSKCGNGGFSTVPTILWAMGTVVIAHYAINSLFRRFLFRRVPYWELIVQDMVFVWMVVYGVRVWFLIVQIGKMTAQNYEGVNPNENWQVYMIQQLIFWMIGLMPLAVAGYLHSQPRYPSPLVIWIAATPWQRREMGPQGYYLNRPLTVIPNTSGSSLRAPPVRRCYSDSDIKPTTITRRQRHSKSC